MNYWILHSLLYLIVFEELLLVFMTNVFPVWSSCSSLNGGYLPCNYFPASSISTFSFSDFLLLAWHTAIKLWFLWMNNKPHVCVFEACSDSLDMIWLLFNSTTVEQWRVMDIWQREGGCNRESCCWNPSIKWALKASSIGTTWRAVQFILRLAQK